MNFQFKEENTFGILLVFALSRLYRTVWFLGNSLV